MPSDPYAEFGGSQVASSLIASQDPYAEFGGQTAAPPQVQQTPNFGARVGNRILQNLNVPAQLNALKTGINEALANPMSRTGGRLPEVWQALKQYSDPANVVGDVLGMGMGGDIARFAGPEAPKAPGLPPAQEVPSIRRLVPPTVEPDIEMQMRGGTDNPPTTQIKGVPNRLGTPEQIKRIQESMVSRDAAKKALESGKTATVAKQLAGTSAGAASDTALFQQAKAENPSGSVSDWAKRAQELKTQTPSVSEERDALLNQKEYAGKVSKARAMQDYAAKKATGTQPPPAGQKPRLTAQQVLAIQKQLAGPDPYASRSAPKMEDVNSTNIAKIGHDGNHMWVEYRNAKVYQYKNVPYEVFQKASNAESTGSYIARNVKGKYETSLKGTVQK